jgi:hypothetical protein
MPILSFGLGDDLRRRRQIRDRKSDSGWMIIRFHPDGFSEKYDFGDLRSDLQRKLLHTWRFQSRPKADV